MHVTVLAHITCTHTSTSVAITRFNGDMLAVVVSCGYKCTLPTHVHTCKYMSCVVADINLLLRRVNIKLSPIRIYDDKATGKNKKQRITGAALNKRAASP